MTSEILLFTRTTGFHHESIPDAVRALKQHLSLQATEDPDDVADCARYDAVVFLSTSGTVLHEAARTALREYVLAGGAFVGVHSAAGTEPEWDWYGELLGARFVGHPDGVQRATAHRHPHPSVDRLPEFWEVEDEWYGFRDVRPDLIPLLTVDQRTYNPGAFTMTGPHLQAWCRSVGTGRSWYTGLGHTAAIWSDPTFVGHVLDGVAWARR